MQQSYMFTLPFPPSVNGMYGGGSGQKRFPSKKYKAWLAACPELEALNINHQVKIRYNFFWPDKRIRDGQNYIKAPLDYLVKQNILKDDNWNIVTSETWIHSGVNKISPKVEIEIILL